MASRLCTRSFAEYKVGEISQALLGKNTAKNLGNYGNEKLGALFGSARLLQPEFVPITPKMSKTTEKETQQENSPKEFPKENRKQMEGIISLTNRFLVAVCLFSNTR